DCNVSMRPAGSSEFGTRCEIKNLNSLRSLLRAVEYEARRQIELLEAGERVVQETRHWNEEDSLTHSLRSKEEAFDYRYFPEPDRKPSGTQAKKLRSERVDRGGDPASIASELGFEAMGEGALASVVDQLIADNPAEFERLRGGDQKVMGFFVGQAMKATQGKADGKVVTALLRERASG